MVANYTNKLLPVIVSGDAATYPLAREFYEAYGLISVCIVPQPIKIVEYSRFIDVIHTPNMELSTIEKAVHTLATDNADKTLILIANSDAMIENVARIAKNAPENLICASAPLEVMLRACDKVEFSRMCGEFGLDTPRTEVIRLAGSEPIEPTAIEFPVVAKPASSSEYAYLQFKGFQKVYFFEDQAQLDALWADLRAVGFEGTFLVQELIEGDDTCIDSITMYINRDGVATLMGSAQVILEDHTPALYGNPVTMITRPMPELWEKVAKMLASVGWHGFANFDLKRDPKTGRSLFMDFNPRIGANSYYNAAAGVNPMQVLIEDVVEHSDTARQVERSIIHSRCPVSLARRYISDAALLAEFDAIVAQGEVYNPVRCPHESLRTRAVGFIMEKNYVRKFKKYYPEPTGQPF